MLPPFGNLTFFPYLYALTLNLHIMKSIIYKPLITQYKPQSIPDFKPKGYRPQYNWKDSESMPTSEPAPETIPEETSSQETTPTETWINPAGTTLITDLNDPAYKQSISHIFKDPSIDVGNMQELLDKFADAGISLRITSGYRPGAHTKQGNQSWHASGYALDVTPGTNETWASLRSKLKNSPELIKYMQDNGFGIIDETTPEMQSRTGATGVHWHIGKDKLAISGLKDILSAHHGIKFPIIVARSGRKLKKQQDKVTSRLYEMADREHKQKHPLTARTDKPLEPVSITSILPGTGDIAEGASIINDLSNKNFGSAALATTLFLVPGNITKIFKHRPANIDNVIKFETFLPERLESGAIQRTYLPEKVNNKPIQEEMLEIPIEIGDSKWKGGTYNAKEGKIILDKNVNPSHYPEILVHEWSHWLDEQSPNILNIFGTSGFTEISQKYLDKNILSNYFYPIFYNNRATTEVGPRLTQILDYLEIKDGNKILNWDEWKDAMDNYIEKHPNNNIKILRESITDGEDFTNWAKTNSK